MREAQEIPSPLDLGAGIRQVILRYDPAPDREGEWKLGRYCAHRAGRALGLDIPRDLANGADRAPLWPEGVVGSITHKRGIVAAAIARQADVVGLGIDIEERMATKTADEVAHFIATPAEEALAAGYSALIDRETFLSLIFSAKESVFKCLYPSVRVFFSCLDAELEAIDFKEGSFLVRLRIELSPKYPAGTVLVGRFQVYANLVYTALTIPKQKP